MDSTELIRQGVLNVELDKKMILDPNGNNPVCKPGLGTGVCERCGKPVSLGKACSSVPLDQRWRMG
jgi:hypothetical protein